MNNKYTTIIIKLVIYFSMHYLSRRIIVLIKKELYKKGKMQNEDIAYKNYSY